MESQIAENNDLETKIMGILGKINYYDIKSDEEIWFTCSCCNKKVTFDCYRYKCLYCKDYDLCSRCFEKRKTNKKHTNGHPLIRFSEKNEWFGRRYESLETLTLEKLAEDFQNETHQFIKCSLCPKSKAQSPLKGLRFKCETCKNDEDRFDMCLECFKKSGKLHKADHTIVVMGSYVLKNFDLEKIEIGVEIGDKLGKGAFGLVCKAKLKDTNQIVACKIISCNEFIAKEKNEQNLLSFKRELIAYKEIKGENVLKFIGYTTKINSSNSIDLYLFTELMEKGNLRNLLENEKDMSYRRRLDIAVDIASGLARIHDLGFIHRDIRPENILIAANNVAKICDMGLAKFIQENGGEQSVCGHKNYMPPEIFSGKYNKKLDVFLFGLTMIELFGYSFSREYDSYGICHVRHEVKVFKILIDLCVSLSSDQRPESRVIEEYLARFKKFMIDLIRSNLGYISLNTEEKNKLFELVLEFFHKENFDENLNPKFEESSSSSSSSISSSKKSSGCSCTIF